ncbi:MAG: serine hydrolase [Candidatus Marinimicrobia bacterium]|nr:serine hydrolase [Candidatus Neomarinimicrobiota bacterium]
MKIKKTLLIYFILVTAVLAQDFKSVDLIINNAIQSQIFPAAALIVGTHSSILYHKAYGRLTYDSNATITDTSIMFDLASLTKVMCTTMSAMKLYENGLLDLQEYVAQTIPEFAQNGKGNVKIENLLLHNSGLPIGYGGSPGENRDQIIHDIVTITPAFPLGTFAYSDLSMVVLAEVISVKADTMFPYYYKNTWTNPLGMFSSMFVPPDSLDFRIAPTLNNVNPGIVHDPLARSLDGLSGNAGLFSNTGDLAKMVQLLLSQGVYKGTRYLQESTVQLFRIRYDPQGSTRALGWDTDCPWMGSLLSSQRFGHTGYTGTSIAMDPILDLFIILLTNRTYPGVAPDLFRTRQLVHDAVVAEIFSASQKIIDNDDTQNYSESGSWYYSNAQAYGSNSRYAYINEGEKPFASFQTVLSKSGMYHIYGILPETVNAANNAVYKLNVNNRVVDSIYVDQNLNSGNWMLLWNRYLPADSSINVRIIDTGESSQGLVLRADAIRFSLDQEINNMQDPTTHAIPKNFKLKQNYPNPFNPTTTIEFEIPNSEFITLKIYNLPGQEVATVFQGVRYAGNYSVNFDAGRLAGGVYLYQLHAGNSVATKKFILLK